MNGNGSNDMFPQGLFPQGFIDYMIEEQREELATELCCGGTRSRLGCEYHDPSLQPPAVAAAPAPAVEAPNHMIVVMSGSPAPDLDRLAAESRMVYLGLDDPEVTNPPEHIYHDPATGGVVGVPQAAGSSDDMVAMLRASGQHARADLLEVHRYESRGFAYAETMSFRNGRLVR